MFNFALLDVAIGLIFIFLVYSLLATSINEVISTLFSLRARMLKTAIAERMLSETKKHHPFVSIARGFLGFFSEIIFFFTGRPEKPNSEKKIGDRFFEHPLIKSYGSSRIFKLPSYIPNKNFSSVITELLKKEFDRRSDDIIRIKLQRGIAGQTRESIATELALSTEFVKVKEIIDYYQHHYHFLGHAPEGSILDKETIQLLDLQIKEGLFTMEGFVRKTEEWFDNTMNRASGWYKRQGQAILFGIGIFLAILFNVDTIVISGKLSSDPETRTLLLEHALAATEKYKDDPRVKKMANSSGEIVLDTAQKSIAHNLKILKEYRDSTKQIIAQLEAPNQIIGLGWDDYGRQRDSLKLIRRYYEKKLCKGCVLDETLLTNAVANKEILDEVYKNAWTKVCYIGGECLNVRKILGLLITAFAICLGAPFWFDLLNKFTKIRGTGKKEGSEAQPPPNQLPATQPVNIHVNTQPGEEAVG